MTEKETLLNVLAGQRPVEWVGRYLEQRQTTDDLVLTPALFEQLQRDVPWAGYEAALWYNYGSAHPRWPGKQVKVVAGEPSEL